MDLPHVSGKGTADLERAVAMITLVISFCNVHHLDMTPQTGPDVEAFVAMLAWVFERLFMDALNVDLQSALGRELFVAVLAHKVPLALMDGPDVDMQSASLIVRLVTILAFEKALGLRHGGFLFRSQMDHGVLVQVLLLAELFATRLTLKRLQLVMNGHHMIPQIDSLSEGLVTKVALVFLFLDFWRLFRPLPLFLWQFIVNQSWNWWIANAINVVIGLVLLVIQEMTRWSVVHDRIFHCHT